MKPLRVICRDPARSTAALSRHFIHNTIWPYRHPYKKHHASRKTAGSRVDTGFRAKDPTRTRFRHANAAHIATDEFRTPRRAPATAERSTNPHANFFRARCLITRRPAVRSCSIAAVVVETRPRIRVPTNRRDASTARTELDEAASVDDRKVSARRFPPVRRNRRGRATRPARRGCRSSPRTANRRRTHPR